MMLLVKNSFSFDICDISDFIDATTTYSNIPTRLFIDNKFVASSGGSTIELESPLTGCRLATVSAAQIDDVDRAVQSSTDAYAVWKQKNPSARRTLLHRLADLVERDASLFASLEAIDAGILYQDSLRLNVQQAVENLRYFAGWADRVDGLTLSIPDGMAYTRRVPIGVCAAIIPWNAPLMITMWKLAPALAGGNTIIINTPEMCPLYGQKLAQLVVEVGFPPGVVNILCGLGHVAGAALSEHMGVRKISFTGSPSVGRQIMAAAARSNLKKLTLELGGKGPSIVFDDADWENALFWTSLGITINNGQRDKVLSFIEAGKSSGARIVSGGEQLTGKGYFVANTAFADVSHDTEIMKEEIFGPLACVASFENEDDVIAKTNDSVYGLGAAVFTTDLNKAFRITEAIEVGQITVNSWGALHANTPFGGVKESGFGRDMGKEAINEWTSAKTVKL
uniref:aldehyde dehydrogenase (NAD(+)) n=1 Tax=Bionectria ochroleuca TaxID=29856 RepID=A0A8H7K5Z4_BIOOC